MLITGQPNDRNGVINEDRANEEHHDEQVRLRLRRPGGVNASMSVSAEDLDQRLLVRFRRSRLSIQCESSDSFDTPETLELFEIPTIGDLFECRILFCRLIMAAEVVLVLVVTERSL